MKILITILFILLIPFNSFSSQQIELEQGLNLWIAICMSQKEMCEKTDLSNQAASINWIKMEEDKNTIISHLITKEGAFEAITINDIECDHKVINPTYLKVINMLRKARDSSKNKETPEGYTFIDIVSIQQSKKRMRLKYGKTFNSYYLEPTK